MLRRGTTEARGQRVAPIRDRWVFFCLSLLVLGYCWPSFPDDAKKRPLALFHIKLLQFPYPPDGRASRLESLSSPIRPSLPYPKVLLLRSRDLRHRVSVSLSVSGFEVYTSALVPY